MGYKIKVAKDNVVQNFKELKEKTKVLLVHYFEIHKAIIFLFLFCFDYFIYNIYLMS